MKTDRKVTAKGSSDTVRGKKRTRHVTSKTKLPLTKTKQKAQDITERKWAGPYSQTLLEAIPDGVLVVNTEGKIIIANSQSEVLFGYKLDELIGQPVEMLIPERFHLHHPGHREKYFAAPRPRQMGTGVELFARRRDGSEFPVDVSLNALAIEADATTIAIIRDITERKQAEAALRDSEKRFRNLFENSPIAIWEEDFSEVKAYLEDLRSNGIIDFDAYLTTHPEIISKGIELVKVLDANQAALNLYEVTSKMELLGGLNRTFPTESLMDFKNELLTVAQGGLRFRSESLVQTFQGNLRNVAVDWVVAPGYEQTYSKVLVSLTDITERKQAEQQLRESQMRLRLFFNQSLDGFFFSMLDEPIEWNDTVEKGKVLEYTLSHQHITEVNDAMLAQYGSTRANFIGRTPGDFFAHDIEQARQFRRKLFDNARLHLETEERKDDGTPIWIEGDYVCIYDAQKRIIGMFGIQRDITVRKQAEEKLRAAEERFRQLADNIQEVFWITDAQSGEEVFISSAVEAIWGMTVESMMQTNSFLESVLPEDRNILQSAMDKQRSGDQTEMEYRIKRTDGSVRWIWDRAFPIFDEAGNVTLVAGIAADVTERKAISETLRESEARFSKAFEYAPIGMALVAPDGRWIRVNQALCKLIGYSAQELLAITFQEITHPDDLEADLEYVSQMLTGEISAYQMEKRYFHKSGQMVWVLLSVSLIWDSNRKPLYFISQIQDITARKQAEEKLSDSEARYRGLFENLVIGFALHEIITNDQGQPVDYVFLEINPAFEKLTGIGAAQAVGRRVTEILPGVENDPFIKMYGKVALTGEPLHTEEFSSPLNKYYEISAYSPKQGQFAVTFADVTERKQAEQETLRHLMELEAVYENGLAVGQLLTTREIGNRMISTFQRYLSWHHVTIRLRKGGLDELELVAYSLPNLIEEKNVEMVRDFENKINRVGLGLSGWVVQTGIPIRTGNVNEYPQYIDIHAGVISGLYMPLKIGEQVIGCISVESELADAFTAQDERLLATLANQAAVAFENARLFQAARQELSERIRAEELLEHERNSLAHRVEERTAELSHANADLARALRVKDEFLATMSHELRTPLNAILGLSESLAEQTAGPLNEKQQRYISTVNENGHHLLSLINDILDLAKIEIGQITLEVTRVDINSVCQASLRMIKQLAHKKNQEVVVAIDAKVSLMWADERRLKQMLVNLLGNAVKFTPAGGKLGLDVHGDQEANRMTFTIWDTGIGIKESDLPRLFQPFVQLDAGLAREASGTGLGLALVAQMAHLHGGSASVTSQPGQGSRFTIMLPWEPALAVDTVERLKATGKFRAIKFNQGYKPTILLIEDTEEVIMMLSDYLELNGYKIVTAHDGVEGVLQAQRTHPDLILMDIQMPRMDGFEATKKLRGEPQFEHTPIIALTALAMPNDRERCLAAGMDDYIIKPVHLRALVKLIENFLSGEKEIKPQ